MTASTNLLIWVALILLAANLAGHLSQEVGLPRVFGKLLVGLLIGPAFLRLVPLTQSLQDMANIGVVLLMFVAGVETDLIEMRKVGGGAFLAAVGGVILPLVAGTGIARAFGLSLYPALFVGTILTATSVSITAQTLQELGRLQTRVGAAIMGAAIIDDILGIVVLAVVTAFEGQSGSWVAIVKLVIFLPVALLVGRYGVPQLVGRLHILRGNDARIAVVVATVLAYAWAAAQLGGLAAITGAYIVGVFIGQTELRRQAAELVSFLGYSFFIPLFFVSVGMAVSLQDLRAAPAFAALLVLGAVITKVVGCFLGALAGRFGLRDATTIGLGMVSRGEVALVIAATGLQTRVIGQAEFSVVVVMTVITTLITPVLLKLAYVGVPVLTPGIPGALPEHSDVGLLEPPLGV
ncbi:MAG: cation:proton antiporter [Dehalococcoidia bacterium]